MHIIEIIVHLLSLKYKTSMTGVLNMALKPEDTHPNGLQIAVDKGFQTIQNTDISCLSSFFLTKSKIYLT